MNNTPPHACMCQSELYQFDLILNKMLSARGNRRTKHKAALRTYFCQVAYDITMRQREYFKELLKELETTKKKHQSAQDVPATSEDVLRTHAALQENAS